MDLPLNNLDFEEIAEQADEDIEIADLGCGNANYHNQLYTILERKLEGVGYDGAITLYGLESSKEKIEEARTNNPDPEFQYINETLEAEKEYSLEKFDIVVSNHLLCETDNTQEVYDEAESLKTEIDGTNQVHSKC